MTRGLHRALLPTVILLATSPPAWGQAFDRQVLLGVLLATDAKQVAACERLGAVGDSSPEDLRKKILRMGGDAGLVTFDPVDPDKINAEVYRCKKRAPDLVPSVGVTPALQPLTGTWVGTLTLPPALAGVRPQFPATVRVWDEGGQLRWKLEASRGDLNGSGTVTTAQGEITLTGTSGSRAGPITYSLTLRGQVLEGAGVGADNVVRLLSLRKQP